jgi:hydroxymethylglutaryl-CoA synthase
MKTRTVGISDIGIHIPGNRMPLQTLVEARSKANPKLARHLERALRVTGQRAIRYPSLWEDTATMAAQAASGMLRYANPVTLPNLRHLVVGTETGVDHSKPVSAYVQGMLQRSGLEVPETLSSFQVQHACAGATLSLISVAGLLGVGERSAESGLVIASDIARYQVASTAEVTQGAGSVALLVETSPRLVELDLSTMGYCSRDVDDFFRPLGSHVARVKGSYSMELYVDSLNRALLDHGRRAGELPAEVLESTDFFVLHTPFRNMPEVAMQKMLALHLGLEEGGARRFLESRGFYAGADVLAEVGNLYSGSMYLFLAGLLRDRYRELGERIVGKRLLLASYGSGNTMIVIAGRVAGAAPDVIRHWDLERVLKEAQEATMQEYDLWSSGPYAGEEFEKLLEHAKVPPESFYLSGIREDGYREYRYSARLRDWLPQREASVDLHRSVPVLG